MSKDLDLKFWLRHFPVGHGGEITEVALVSLSFPSWGVEEIVLKHLRKTFYSVKFCLKSSDGNDRWEASEMKISRLS